MGALTLAPWRVAVSSLAAARRFYEEVLGLTVTDRGSGEAEVVAGGGCAVLLKEVRGRVPRDPRAAGCTLRLTAASTAELSAVCGRLTQRGVRVTPIAHGPAWFVFTTDPDGTPIEISCASGVIEAAPRALGEADLVAAAAS